MSYCRLLLPLALAICTNQAATGQSAVPRAEVGEFDRGIGCLTFSTDGKILATADFSGRVKLWNTTSGAELFSLPKWASEGDAPLGQLKLSPGLNEREGLVATTPPFGGISLWDRATGKQVFGGGQAHVASAMAFSPDGQFLAYTTTKRSDFIEVDVEVVVCEVHGMKERRRFPAKHPGPSQLVFSADGTLLAAGGHTVRVWEFETGKARFVRGLTKRACGVTFSPDNKSLAFLALPDEVQLWELATGQLRSSVTLSSPARMPQAFAVAPDGKHFVTGDVEGSLTVWDFARMAVVSTTPAHRDWVTAIAFTPDGKTLASSGFDKKVKLWDVAALLTK